jgi:hypothetical protein
MDKKPEEMSDDERAAEARKWASILDSAVSLKEEAGMRLAEARRDVATANARYGEALARLAQLAGAK